MFNFNRRVHALPRNGGYTLVGSVPFDLAFETDAQGEILEKIAWTAANCGSGFARELAEKYGFYFRIKIFKTIEEARDAVLAHGLKFGNPTPEEIEEERKNLHKKLAKRRRSYRRGYHKR